MDNENEPLLHGSNGPSEVDNKNSINSDDAEVPERESTKNENVVIIKPKRTIVVEPILIILTMCYFPLSLVQSLYTYHQFEMQAAKELGVKILTGNQSHYCDINKSSVEYHVTHLAQTHNSFFIVMLSLVGSVPCVITTLFLGPYSDKAGRRYAIIIPLITGFMNVMVNLVVIQFNLSVWYLLVGTFIDGMGGKFTMLLLGCFSYIADTTESKNRVFRITVLECIFFMSAMLGPIGVGNLIESIGYVWPVLIVASGYFINICYALFFVPETIIKDPDVKFWTTTQIKTMIHLFTKDTEDKRRWKLRHLFLVFMPVIISMLGDNTTTLFLQNVPLCWGSAKIGDFMSIYIGVSALGGIVSAKVLKLCVPDYGIALISVSSSVVKNVYHGFVHTDVMVYIIPAFSIVSMLIVPTLRAMMSIQVGPREQGAVFGAIAICEIVLSFAGSFIFSAVYAGTISFMAGFVYFVEAVFYFIGFIIMLLYVIRLRRLERINRGDTEKRTPKDD